MFIIEIFSLIDEILDEDLYEFFTNLAPFLYPIVFVIVLLMGYIQLFKRTFSSKTEDELPHEKMKRPFQEKPQQKSWKDLGNEFRLTISDVLARMRNPGKK